MHRTNAQSTIVPDAIAIIAACTGSRAMMELAVALRAIVSGAVLLPPDRADAISRIAADLMNPQWNMQAHLTLKNPLAQYFAKAFCRACIQAVPLTPENPTRDLRWQQRVKEVLERDASLQSHAMLLLQQVKLRVTSAQPVVAPAITVNAPPSPKYDKAELHAKARQFAEEFVRRREAQKARAREANATVPLNQSAPSAEPTPPVQPQSIAESASTPRRARVLRNAASLARYASMQPLLGVCPTSGIPSNESNDDYVEHPLFPDSYGSRRHSATQIRPHPDQSNAHSPMIANPPAKGDASSTAAVVLPNLRWINADRRKTSARIENGP